MREIIYQIISMSFELTRTHQAIVDGKEPMTDTNKQ